MQRHLKYVHDLVKGKPVHLRSPKWHKVEKAHLAKEPACQWCGAKVELDANGKPKKPGPKLQVHHIAPFHLAPALELDPANFITLCEEGGYLNCHLFHGHNGDWKSFNDKVREDCEEHAKDPERQILEAVRKQDPKLYEFLVKARIERKKHA
ncbi:hypothetical protein SBDP2_320004 [Syntrophobacter sp. SbD2]|nr:hypothetical protein SBDP2_320004 [Syntrophobacter sp. SbD2]